MAAGVTDLLARAGELLSEYAPLGLAVSGGVDSRLLTAIALRSDVDFACVHFRGPHQTRAETKWALAWFSSQGISPLIIDSSPLDLPELAMNPQDRCYHCKRSSMARALDLLREQGIPTLADGSNLDDHKEYRPGRKALKELGVISPLALAGFDKSAIRTAANTLGLAWPDQPSRACLLTRFPYGRPLVQEDVERVGKAEDDLAGLGFKLFRVRMTDRDSPELHLDHSEEPLLQTLKAQARKTLSRHFPKGCPIRLTKRLSGFYDTALGIDAEQGPDS